MYKLIISVTRSVLSFSPLASRYNPLLRLDVSLVSRGPATAGRQQTSNDCAIELLYKTERGFQSVDALDGSREQRLYESQQPSQA